MMITRRRLIAAAAGARLTLGQQFRNNVSITPDSGLRLQREGDPQHPAVALFLPDFEHPSAIIEMPEHAWRKEKRLSEPTWFYKMYTSDPSLRGDVKWSKETNSISYAMKTPSGFTLSSRATLEADGVVVTHQIISSSVHDLAAVEAPTCAKLYRPFTDIFLERTYVHHSEGIELVASETPERLTKNAEEWLPCRYIVLVGKNSRAPQKRTEQLDGVTRYFKSRPADVAFIATESQPSGWVAATHGLNCPSVFTNPARTCQHADPEAQDIHDGQAILRLKLYMLRGTVRDAWDLVQKRDAAGEV